MYVALGDWNDRSNVDRSWPNLRSSSKFVNGVLGSIFNDLPEELRKADFIAESEEETKKTEEESK